MNNKEQPKQAQPNFWALAILALVLIALFAGVLFWLIGQPEVPVARTSENYGGLRMEQFTVTSTGTAGAATGTGDSDGWVRGHVYAINLDYTADISTTTDVTLTGTNGSPSLTIMTKTDSATDTWYYPAIQQTDSSGAAISGAYDRLPISDRVHAAVAESTAAVITVTVYWGD